jgi:glutamate formiminotransferase / 5-formyltetrahydrofolate cyclo-ligase
VIRIGDGLHVRLDGVLECVINISEGRELERVARIAAAAGGGLLDVHSDPHHHRSVLTIVGEEAARAVASAAIAELDLRAHDGVHPRLGVVDVVPFVALDDSGLAAAAAARDAFAGWMAEVHAVPCFLYDEDRTLPDVRRAAFRSMLPDTGPPSPHPTAGATAVGARPPLVAFNVWVARTDLVGVRRLADDVRQPGIRTLGLEVGPRFQVSMNLVDPLAVGPAAAFDAVEQAAARAGAEVAGAELVGLVPAAVLRAAPRSRWDQLDLAEDRTIEARLEARGIR